MLQRSLAAESFICCDRQSKSRNSFSAAVYQQSTVTAPVTVAVTVTFAVTATATAEWTRSEQLEPPVATAV